MDRITWTDGARWAADDATYAALRRQLDGLRDVVVGLDAVLDRWPSAGATLIDAFAPTEADRAVLTAALARAVDDAATLDREALGLRTVTERDRYLAALDRLAALARTDVTW